MPLMDTHCHLDFEAFDHDRDEVLRLCKEADIEALMVPSIGARNWHSCLKLQARHPQIKVALGLHPYFIESHSEEDLDDLEVLIGRHRHTLSAVGEIGLDDTVDDYDKQLAFFEAQLSLAEKHSLPVIMHIRRHQGAGLKAVKRHSLVGGVVHAFAGSLDEATSWLELGMKIGVGGVITYERAKKTRSTIAQLPLESIVLETDAPDMAVQGVSKGSGSPLLLVEVFKTLCSLRSESPEQIREVLWQNSQILFGQHS